MLLSYIKAFHVIAIIAWMAGLLYLPRLFVYHAGAAKGSELSETFKVMEKRLLRYITTPAMIASWILGLYLAFTVIDWKADGWFHAKLGLVLLLSAFHGALAKWTKDFAADAQHARCALLPHDERGADAVDDRHRDSGDRATLLNKRCKPVPPSVLVCYKTSRIRSGNAVAARKILEKLGQTGADQA